MKQDWKFINVFIPHDYILERNQKAFLISFKDSETDKLCGVWIELRHLTDNIINMNAAIHKDWDYKIFDVYDLLQITSSKAAPIHVIKGIDLAKSLRKTFELYNMAFNKWDISHNSGGE